jgi:hypothetical protein
MALLFRFAWRSQKPLRSSEIASHIQQDVHRVAGEREFFRVSMIVSGTVLRLSQLRAILANLIRSKSLSTETKGAKTMSPKHNSFELSDEDLRIVAGAMDCATARAVATAYVSIGSVLAAEGNVPEATVYKALAAGVLQGGCY